jgi:3-hydroxybutyryl-CoA dehydrogenase
MTEQICVVGAGVMGSGIAQVLALAGHPVVCRDVAPEQLDRAREAIARGRFGLANTVERGKATQEEAAAALTRLTFTTDLDEAVDGADVVIEAVPEDLQLKIDVFRDLDHRCAAATILASNTSGFSITALAAATVRPTLVIGWHYSSPVPATKLSEIIAAPSTSQPTIDTIVRLAAAAGKNPVVIQDQPRVWGHVTNRVYGAMTREARRVVEEGIATAEQVDQLMVDCYRWPVGPLAMSQGAVTGWRQTS